MRKTRKPLIGAMCALVLALGVNATYAWLTDTTEAVTNTFTVGNIDITLEESDNLDLKMIPGEKIAKDPVVAVKGGSEACWLFVKVAEDNNAIGDVKFIEWGIGEGWITLDGQSGVYYREVSADEAKSGVEYVVLNTAEGYGEGYVTVNEDVTKTMMDSFDANKDGTLSKEESEALPTLSFTAYAVQKAGVEDVAAAWTKVNPDAQP